MGKGLCLCLFLLSTIHSIVFSQNQINNSNWTTIERAIKEKHNLDSVSQKLIQLKNEAKASSKDVEFLRAIYYLIAIDDQRKEDTFYFRNSAFIDTLLLREPNPKAELVLHLLQAMRL